MNNTHLLHKINCFFVWNKLSSKLIALVLVMTTLLGTFGVNISNMKDTYASGPVGDVIYNYPYTSPTGPSTPEQIPWNKGWDSILSHKGFDRAYTNHDTGNYQNLTPAEIDKAKFADGTSGYYNGFVTDEHVVINNGSVSFYGYQIPQYMDYVFTDRISAVKQISFNMNPLNMVFHTFYQSGFLFNGTMDAAGNYTGYALILECSNTEGMLTTGVASLRLYFLENELMNTNRFTPGNVTTTRTLITTIKTGIENYSTPNFGIDLQMDPVTRAFKLYVDGAESANIPAAGVRGTGVGVGFFTGYYEHNCSILSAVRYSAVAIDATFPLSTQETAAVKFMIEGTNTEIRLPETETGWLGQRYRVVQPSEIVVDDKTYTLRSNSQGYSIDSDIVRTYYGGYPNETILYYYVQGFELGDPDLKTARVNGGPWNPGSESVPVEVRPGDEIEYRIWANGSFHPMLARGGSAASDDTQWYRQPTVAPAIEKQTIASIKFVSLSSNYSTPAEFTDGVGEVWEGKAIVKAWDATETSSDNPNSNIKVFAWVVASTVAPSRYDLYIGGLGGVWLARNASSQFSNFTNCTNIDFTNFHTELAVTFGNMFNNCSALTSLNLSSFNTSNVTIMYYMFNNCSALTSINLSSFNTSKVTTMSNMFNDCSALTSLNLSSFNTSNVTTMYYMFNNCSALTSLNLSSFNTSKVTTMNYMFNNCSALTSLNLNTFNTSNVTSMTYMFRGCAKLTSLDLRTFNTSKVLYMNYMFSGCSGLTSLNISTFNTSNVISMSSMFAYCSKLTSLNLSSFNNAKSQVTSADYMFRDCSILTSISMENADFTGLLSGGIFSGTPNTASLFLTVYVGTTEMEAWVKTRGVALSSAYYSKVVRRTPPAIPAPITPTAPTLTPTPPKTASSTITDVVPDGLTIIPASITGTPSATSIPGSITWTLSGQTIVWTVYDIPAEVLFKATVNAVTEPHKLYENYATTKYYNSFQKETNHTYHSSSAASDINEQYYIFDGLLNNSALLQDNAFHGGVPNKVDPGEDYDFDPAHAPSTMYGYSYYGYQYIDAVTDDPGSPQGVIHQGLPPATLFSNVQSDKIIRYYYKLTPITVTVYFVNESGAVIKTAVVTTQPAGSNYSMPPSYLDSFVYSSDTYNYYGYELSNTVGTAKTVGAQADKSILLSTPQFSNIQSNQAITLYFTDTPTVTVNFVEYLNAFNSLKSSETYFVTSDKKFTPPAELTDDITSLGKLYEYVSYWSLDGGTTMNTGNPSVITGIDENKDLTLYFRTQYEITEKFHPKDPTGTHNHGHGPEPYWTPLKPDINTSKYGGESFTGTPPATIPVGADIWNYIGYRVGDDDTAAITYAYPPDPTIANVNDDVTFIYVYEKAAAGDPTATKSARISTNGSTWSAYSVGTPESPISVDTGNYIEYRIVVSGVTGTANLTITDLLPEGLELYGTGSPSPSSGFSSTKVGNRVEVKWSGNYSSSTRTFTVRTRVTAASGLFINNAMVDTPAKKNILTNSTYHRTGFVLTEQFRELDNETNILFPNRTVTVPVGSAYTENPENLLAMDWTYVGWRLGSDPTVHPPGTPTPDTIIASVNGADTITYLYKPTPPPTPKTENILHIRQIVIDPVSGIETPIMGYFELTGGGNSLPLISESGIEGVYVTQFSEYKLVGDVAFNVYDFIPQYYEFAGHYKNTGTSPDAEHDDSDERILPNIVANGSIILDYSSEGEYWLTVYTKPRGVPSDYEWDYATNDFGSINR